MLTLLHVRLVMMVLVVVLLRPSFCFCDTFIWEEPILCEPLFDLICNLTIEHEDQLLVQVVENVAYARCSQLHLAD